MRGMKLRRAAIALLAVLALGLAAAAGSQPAPSAAESVLGAPPK